MKTYLTVAAFEADVDSGQITIQHGAGVVGTSLYFVGYEIGTTEHVFKVLL